MRVGAGDKVIVEPVLLDFVVAELSLRLRIDSASGPTKGEEGCGSPEGPKVLVSGEGATGLPTSIAMLAPESTLGRRTAPSPNGLRTLTPVEAR